MILKPGEQVPLTVLRTCEVLETVLPKDVISGYAGYGHRGVKSPHHTSPSHNDLHDRVPRQQVRRRRSLHQQLSSQSSASLAGEMLQIVSEDADLDRTVGDATRGHSPTKAKLPQRPLDC